MLRFLHVSSRGDRLELRRRRSSSCGDLMLPITVQFIIAMLVERLHDHRDDELDRHREHWFAARMPAPGHLSRLPFRRKLCDNRAR
jgi:hypothetical protein